MLRTATRDPAAVMRQLVLLTQLVVHVWSEGLPPPADVRVDPVLRWTAAPGHGHATYTVQYLSFDEQWQDISSCIQSHNTSCDVTASSMKEADFGCVRLRVHAHEHSLTSDSVEACSQQGNSCSPEVQLTSQPGTLTVHLSADHLLVYNHGSQVQHLVYYAREGEPLQAYGYSPASVVIKELEEGQRYCVKVVFVYYNTPLGPPSCIKCQNIPQSDERAKVIEVTLGVVFSVTVVLMVLLLFYMFLFQSERIKKWIQPYQKAQCITEPFNVKSQQLVYSPSEECLDRVSHIVPVEDHQPST